MKKIIFQFYEIVVKLVMLHKKESIQKCPRLDYVFLATMCS